MAPSCQTVAQTLADVIEKRPVLEPVLRAFEPILTAQAELAPALETPVREAGLRLPEVNPQRLSQGASLLAGAPLTGIAGPLRASAEKILPLVAAFEALAPHKTALEGFFLRPTAEEGEDERQILAEAFVSGNGETFQRLAAENGLDPAVLEFAMGFVLAPVLRAMVSQALPEDGASAPWEEGGAWSEGYCPVCGSLPVLGWLDKRALEEKNAFLSGGGGKKHLYCSLCGTSWKFRRGACPSCGEEGSGVMEILRESGAAHGERLDWCTRCKGYCPTVDLRERGAVPDMDVMALGMVHLDMVAARKGLSPLKPSFWNMF